MKGTYASAYLYLQTAFDWDGLLISFDGYADQDRQSHHHYLKAPLELTVLSVPLRRTEPRNPNLLHMMNE